MSESYVAENSPVYCEWMLSEYRINTVHILSYQT